MPSSLLRMDDDDVPLSINRTSIILPPSSSTTRDDASSDDNIPIASSFPDLVSNSRRASRTPSNLDQQRLSLTSPTSPILSHLLFSPYTQPLANPASNRSSMLLHPHDYIQQPIPASAAFLHPSQSQPSSAYVQPTYIQPPQPSSSTATTNSYTQQHTLASTPAATYIQPLPAHTASKPISAIPPTSTLVQIKRKLSGGGRFKSSAPPPTKPIRNSHALAPNSPSLRQHLHQLPIRKKSLVRRDRDPHLIPPPPIPNNSRLSRSLNDLPPPRISTDPLSLPRTKDYAKPQSNYRLAWVYFSKLVTFYAIPPLFRALGMKNKDVQQASREKLALCTIILFMMALLAFITFALNDILCQPVSTSIDSSMIDTGFVIINGYGFDVTTYNHNFARQLLGPFPFDQMYASNQPRQNRDLSFLFQSSFGSLPDCMDAFGPTYIAPSAFLFPCTIGGVPPESARKFGNYPAEYCHAPTFDLQADIQSFVNQRKRVQLFVTWEELENVANPFMAFNGDVIDLSVLDRLKVKVNITNINGIDFGSVFQKYRNKDASLFLSSNPTLSAMGKCLSQFARVGSLDSTTMGCIASQVILWVSLLVILSLVLSRFFMALLFRWVIAPKLGLKLSDDEKRHLLMQRKMQDMENEVHMQSRPSTVFSNHSSVALHKTSSSSVYRGASADGRRTPTYDGQVYLPTTSPTASPLHISENISGNERSTTYYSRNSTSPFQSNSALPEPDITVQEVMHTILLVTCYSEDEAGIRTTLDSLASTVYQDSHKLLFVIADGIIIGSGNHFSTPDMLVSMLEKDETFPEQPKPYSYVAIADGAKRHNMAVVHAGYYNVENHRVPMVIVVKCGGPDEQGLPKAGNRGKRDSQVVLMSFLQKVMFDERMTPLEYDLFQKIHKITKVTPDAFEMVLCVDADTKVAPDSLERMVACFARDPQVMGLCGETQIHNKWGSWVTMIQVFEYYISHHLAKAFESVFGGVTCLPGCFCAYRIKAPKGENGRHWVPILANPDIVDQYQENVVETLHEKNLFLLGEDRYLTTLMLRTFPQRKMLFVPQATCETMVPDEFSVLLSQRRRWINSTIHNLLELVLVKDLCGTFCISMQFVIFMELVGTVVLPAAITFTIYLIVISFFVTPVPIIPLLLLAAVLGLPGLLIILTTRKIQFLFWMVVYILSLPVWNFFLPTYAFWHFDDFSWGATRLVEGGNEGHGDDDGEFDSTKIIMKRWSEWEQIKHRAIAQALEVAAQQHQQAYRRSQYPTQMQAYYGVENQLVRGNGLQYTM